MTSSKRRYGRDVSRRGGERHGRGERVGGEKGGRHKRDGEKERKRREGDGGEEREKERKKEMAKQ